jgi:hypothetical protein
MKDDKPTKYKKTLIKDTPYPARLPGRGLFCAGLSLSVVDLASLK